jgi:hypothetical protein
MKPQPQMLELAMMGQALQSVNCNFYKTLMVRRFGYLKTTCYNKIVTTNTNREFQADHKRPKSLAVLYKQDKQYIIFKMM